MSITKTALMEKVQVLLSVVSTQHALIKLLEWHGGYPDHDGQYSVCPACTAHIKWGHYPECPMEATLKAYDKAAKREGIA